MKELNLNRYSNNQRIIMDKKVLKDLISKKNEMKMEI